MSALGGGTGSGFTESQIKGFVKEYGGFGFYTNSTYTQGSPLTVSVGNTQSVDFPVIAREKLPDGFTTLFSNGRISSSVIDSTYDIRIGFFAASSNNNGAFGVDIDISAAGDGSIVVAEDVRRMVRGGNEYQFYTIPLPTFSADTYVANGGLVRFQAVDGNISFYDLQLLVIKTT